MSKPIVALIGRPNVGKSTLFNRILQKRVAIVDDMPGVTRDRHYEEAEWAGYHFVLTDTGGLIPTAEAGIELSVREQAEIAIREAAVIVFLTDVEVGVTEEDLQIARFLQSVKKPVVVAVNKVDIERRDPDVPAFYQLGLGDPMPISAQHSRYVGELLDQIISFIPKIDATEQDTRLKIAIIGRPNVGKSSLVNRLSGTDSVIVHEQPGTTRDAIDTVVKYYGKAFILIDTAGLRKRTKVKEQIEYYSMLRTQKAVQQCDVAIVLLDASAGVLAQDVTVARMAADERVGIIIAINKWDLIEKDTKTAKEFTLNLHEKLPFLAHAPTIYISALTGQRVTKLYEVADQVNEALTLRIQTSDLNALIERIVKRNHPPAAHGKHIKIYYATQTGIKPPTFILFCNYPELLPKNYLRYIENEIRKEYGFVGAPFRLHFQKRHTE